VVPDRGCLTAGSTLPVEAGRPEPEATLWTTTYGLFRGIAGEAIGYGSGMAEGPVPDSAMDTKSEDGEPGDEEREDSRPLDPDEQAMLAQLREAGVRAPESDPGGGTTLPPPPPEGGGPDPLDPVFREPNP
jgi:hypothetical protein